MWLIWKFWFGSCVTERSKASTPTTSIHLHYCMQWLSFSRSVDRVLSSSRRLYCLSMHFWMHRPPPFTFRCILNRTVAWMSGTERWMVCCKLLRDKIAFQDPLRYQRASKWWQCCDRARVWNGQERQCCQLFWLFMKLNHSHFDRLPNLRLRTCGSSRGPLRVKPLDYRNPRHPPAMSCVRNNQSFHVFKQQQMMEQINNKSVKNMVDMTRRQSIHSLLECVVSCRVELNLLSPQPMHSYFIPSWLKMKDPGLFMRYKKFQVEVAGSKRCWCGCFIIDARVWRHEEKHSWPLLQWMYGCVESSRI
jgi:hypothetical protein